MVIFITGIPEESSCEKVSEFGYIRSSLCGALACKMSTEMIIVGMQAFPVKQSLSMIESDITEQIC